MAVARMADAGYTSESGRVGKEQARAFGSALVGWVFDYYEVFLLTILIVPIAQALDLSSFQTGAVFSVELGCMAAGGVIFGALADKYGRRDVLMWTVIIYAGATMARALVPNYTVLLVLTAIAAFGIGGEYGVGQALVSEIMPRNRRGWWSGLLYGGIYIGIMMASVVGGQLTPLVGWRWTFALSGLPLLFAIYIRRKAPESDVWSAQREKTSGPGLRLVCTRRFLAPFMLCLVAGTLQFFAYYGVTTFLPTYLVSQGFDMGQASWWLFFTGLAGLVGCFMGAYTSDRWGRRITLSYLSGAAAVGGVVLFFTWGSLLDTLWILVPFFFLYLGSNGATVFGALFSELFPTEVRSTGVSSALQIARGLTFIPPLVTAFIMPRYGYAPVVLIGAAEFGLLALWAWVFRETRGISVAEEKQHEPLHRGADVALND